MALQCPPHQCVDDLGSHTCGWSAQGFLPYSKYDVNVLPYRPGDKNQLKAQDVTAKLVRFDILRKVPKNNLFCIKHT